MKVYISGQIKDSPDYEERFRKAERYLVCKRGYYVLNPAKLQEAFPGLKDDAYFTLATMILDYADAIYMLQGWQNSIGSQIERMMAIRQGKSILYEKADDRE